MESLGRCGLKRPPPLPSDHRSICSICGEARFTKTDFAPHQLTKKQPRCRACAPNKYGNKAAGGHQSRKENKHAIKFRAVYGGGLREQVIFLLIPEQRDAAGKLIERPCTYVADFVLPDGSVIDAKGMRTDVYRIKKKLMLHVHKIQIQEI